MDIHVPCDFHHFAYKQIARSWSNNHWFVRRKHCFIWITSTLMIVAFLINWSRMFALQMCCKFKLKTLKKKKNDSIASESPETLRVFRSMHLHYTAILVFSSKVLHKIWRIFRRSFDLTSLSNILYKTKQKAVSFLLATSSVSRDLSCMTSFSLPHGVSLFGNIERCVVVSFSGPTYIHESDVEHALCAFSGVYWEYF